MTRILTCLATVAALLGSSAQAASQGEVGATSSGSIAITLSVAKRVQFGGLSDVTFAEVSPGSAARSTQSLCVWSNTATRGYSVTAVGDEAGDGAGDGAGDAAGDAAGGGFMLRNGAATARYAVAWSAAPGQPSGTSLAPGAALTGLTSSATSADCAAGGAANASLIVAIDAADVQQAQAEPRYAGALNLLVSPQ